jgi:hypothetical protein
MILDEGVMRFLKNQFSLLIITPEKGFNKVKLPLVIFLNVTTHRNILSRDGLHGFSAA